MILGAVLLLVLFAVGLAIVISREGTGEEEKKAENKENKPQ